MLHREELVACLQTRVQKPQDKSRPTSAAAQAKVQHLSHNYKHTHTHAYTHPCTLMYACTHTHTHTHTHSPPPPLSSPQASGSKWLKASQKSRQSYSLLSKALNSNSIGQFSMATSSTQKFLGREKGVASSSGHMTMLVSSLMDAGLCSGSAVENCLPCHQTDIGSMQELMRQLMDLYSIVGVRIKGEGRGREGGKERERGGEGRRERERERERERGGEY